MTKTDKKGLNEYKELFHNSTPAFRSRHLLRLNKVNNFPSTATSQEFMDCNKFKDSILYNSVSKLGKARFDELVEFGDFVVNDVAIYTASIIIGLSTDCLTVASVKRVGNQIRISYSLEPVTTLVRNQKGLVNHYRRPVVRPSVTKAHSCLSDFLPGKLANLKL